VTKSPLQNEFCNGPLQEYRAISSDLLFWLSLGLKLVLTAGIVVSASVVVERAGPLIGALVVTLPVTVWPAYVFLSLDHDAIYIAASAQSGLAVNAASGVFMLVYLVLAQTRGLIASLLAAVACWIGLAWLARSIAWTTGGAALLNLVVYSVCLGLSRRFREVKAPRAARQWYELPLRTALVCALMGTVLGLSHWAGPSATGMLAVYPISTTCTMLVLHTRIGGRASAAVIANGLWGLLGIGGGLLALSLAILPLGTAPALALALAVPVSWNLSVWIARQRRLRAAAKRRPTS
jgi:hypothetical protein